jgi:hypothetical protein
MINVVLVTVCLAATFACDSSSLNMDAYAAAPIVWTAPSLVRVGRADPPAASSKASISAARGEYESFQIVIRAPTGGLTNVDVIPSDLTQSGTWRIDHSNVTLYREHYVYVNGPSPNRGGLNNGLGEGWYPDALIFFKILARDLIFLVCLMPCRLIFPKRQML